VDSAVQREKPVKDDGKIMRFVDRRNGRSFTAFSKSLQELTKTWNIVCISKAGNASFCLD
jgi:hypothetical protein